jgi:hypothetical protein
MNTPITPQVAFPHAMPPTVPQGVPAGHAWTRTASQRLPVWDERARKMGFPPSSR